MALVCSALPIFPELTYKFGNTHWKLKYGKYEKTAS
jgi:hypothetical protein